MKNAFGIKKNDCVSIVGAGGKTSLLFMLGDLFQPALLTTTTKIFHPLTNDVFIDQLPDDTTKTAVIAKSQKDDKLYGFTCEDLKQYKSEFSYTFIEADGSRMLPLKGWSENEPVVCDMSNKTIGVLDITALNKPVETTVFRVDELKKITTLNKRVSLENLVDIILSDNGLFKRSKFKILYINKVETEELELVTKELINLLKKDQRFHLDRIVYGSIFEKSFTVAYTKLGHFILASGQSKRMGENKLLLKYKDIPVIEHTLSLLNKCPEDVYILANNNDYFSLAKQYDCHLIMNPNYAMGQSSSIRLATTIDVDHYAYYLGDMPNLSLETIHQLRETHKDITMITDGINTSAPLYISAKYKNELAQATGDVGAKQVLKNHPNNITYIKVKEQEMKDIDQREDLNT